jgi:hypothetical protein
MTLRDGRKEYWLRSQDLDRALNKKVHRRVAEDTLRAEGLIKLDSEGRPPKHVLGTQRPRIYRIDARKLRRAG